MGTVLNLKGGFIHIPVLPEQVIQSYPVPFIPLEMTRKALSLLTRG
ncbi:MAG: hypothetical protein BRC41_07195 [Cyanobacteria bacterium QH_9_48_43]|nr:MAG: hypothetical protein BRC42_01535 [Cyanobacteria bacterium QS_1_48_34]PSO86275.1 MAG: hypothetical protein BRC41_07195 [Cyanobacteria bacterium QH_9_48_43]PSO90722.1 MAG: hypothetical protein BRC48_16910 [Cyanobacteria bacterium QS_9_48_30]